MATDTNATPPATPPAAPPAVGTPPPATPPAVAAPPATPPAGAPAETLLTSPPPPAGNAAPPADNGDGKGKTDQEQKGDASKASAELTIKVPEGFTADDALLGKFKETAKAAGLTAENAQKVFDVYADSVKAAAEQQKAAWQKQRADWTESVKTDKEFGGSKFQENLGLAKKVMATYGDAELDGFLTQSGVGDNPGLTRFVMRLGAALFKEGSTRGASAGAGPSPGPEAQLKTQYPSMFPKDS